MTKIERIEYMLKMCQQRPKKDDAGIYIPSGMDSAVKARVLTDILKILKPGDNDLRTETL